MLSVKAVFTEYPNERGETIKAVQEVSFDMPESKLFTLPGPNGGGCIPSLLRLDLGVPCDSRVFCDITLQYLVKLLRRAAHRLEPR